MTADATLPASGDLTPELLARWEELAAHQRRVAKMFNDAGLRFGVADILNEGADTTLALLSGVRSRDAQIAELEGVIARALAEADDWSKSPPGESAPTRAVGDLFADILRPGATNG